MVENDQSSTLLALTHGIKHFNAVHLFDIEWTWFSQSPDFSREQFITESLPYGSSSTSSINLPMFNFMCSMLKSKSNSNSTSFLLIQVRLASLKDQSSLSDLPKPTPNPNPIQILQYADDLIFCTCTKNILAGEARLNFYFDELYRYFTPLNP